MNAYFAEFFGTALLILLGNGVVANVCLNKTKGQSSGWIVITTAWAFAVYVAVVVTGPYSGAHLNPAVTLGVAMKGAFAWELVPGYIAVQVVGGMVGALLVYIIYKDLRDFLPCWSKHHFTWHSRKHTNWFRFYRSITCSHSSVGNWFKLRWHNRLCDQPSSRSWSTFNLGAFPWWHIKSQSRLGIQLGSCCRSIYRCGFSCSILQRNYVIYSNRKSGQNSWCFLTALSVLCLIRD